MDKETFISAVDDGLKLSKRIYGGRDHRATSAPSTPTMERSRPSDLLPTAPMVYAVIYDPAIVDNPDMPSYQPHVYGTCDPPALIPLQMREVEVAVDCHVETAVVTVRGRWRVHCVMGSRSCDCWFLVPTGEQVNFEFLLFINPMFYGDLFLSPVSDYVVILMPKVDEFGAQV